MEILLVVCTKDGIINFGENINMKSISETIKEIINNFAKQGIVFSNEQDFQFQLSLKLIDAVDDEKKKIFKTVKLEVLSLNNLTFEQLKEKVNNKEKMKKDKENPDTSEKKEYCDIIAETSDGKFVAIELKYKTPGKLCYYETPNGEMITMIQGAYDFGAHGFLKDVERLKNINRRDKVDTSIGKIEIGFAILLTNDYHYRFSDFSGSKIWKHYSICEGKSQISGTLPIIVNGQKAENYKGKTPARLEGTYNLEWCNYELPNKAGGLYDDYSDSKNTISPGFSYLMVEVNPI